MARAIRIRAPDELPFTSGSPRAIRDSIDQSGWDPDYAYLARNMYPLDPDFGPGGWLGRPGYLRAGTGTTKAQAVHQFTKLNGTERTLKVDAGEIYEYDWGGNAWTKRISTANLTSASITLSATAIVYAVTFADKVVFNDGVNQPFMWDGTAGAGLTKLTNAPATCYGQPVIYFSKLVFIKAAERSTFVWSEENQPNTGYEAGGYNNAWTLGQTSQNPLFALAPTEEALVYLRDHSVGAIWGRMNAEFQTTGTHEAISSTVGTRSPGGVVVDRDRVWFIDTRGRPQRFVLAGSDERPVWEDCRETIKTVLDAQLASARAILNPIYRMVQFAVVDTTGTVPNRLLNFSAVSGEFLGHWTGLSPLCMTIAKNAAGRPTLIHGESDGEVYHHADPESDSVFNDAPGGTTTAINNAFETGPLGYHPMVVKVWDRVDLMLRQTTNTTKTVMTITTPTSVHVSTLPAVSGAGSVWDTAIWDESVWGGLAYEQRETIGLNIFGRWARFRLRNAELSEQLGTFGVTAIAIPDDTHSIRTA